MTKRKFLCFISSLDGRAHRLIRKIREERWCGQRISSDDEMAYNVAWTCLEIALRDQGFITSEEHGEKCKSIEIDFDADCIFVEVGDLNRKVMTRRVYNATQKRLHDSQR